MKKSMVVYWSQTGNTEAMAKAITFIVITLTIVNIVVKPNARRNF